MLKLTKKYFEHSRGFYYHDWNEELLNILSNSMTSRENHEISFAFNINRCFFEVSFDSTNGKYKSTKQYYKSTNTNVGSLILPCVELFGELIKHGYMEVESEDK